MTSTRSRRLATVVALALLPVTGCGGDDPPARSDAGRRQATADATGSTLASDGLATGNPAPPGGSGDSPPSGGPGPSKTSPGPATATGTATGQPGGGSPTTTAPGSATTTTTTAPVGGCPDPRGCPRYRLIGGRWPRDANGIVTIHYRVKADGHTPVNVPPITPEQTIAAVRAAAQAWMDAVPTVRLVYDGTTTADPKGGNNVVGWEGPTSTSSPALAGAEFTPQREGPTYTGFSIGLNRNAAYTWRPCDPARGTPCDDDPYQGYDLVGVLAHEWGHALGLDHVYDLETEELTMNPDGDRHKATLGLGDVLGARSLYPTNAPMPTLYRP